jgi:hypothetical protein
LFDFALGTAWQVSGRYAQIMLVAGVFQFITVPVDKGAVIVGAHKFILLWNMSRLFGVISALALVFFFQMSIYSMIWFLAINNIFAYLTNLWFENKFSFGYIH